MALEYILFDLDDTIYPRSTPIMPTIGEKIKTFMVDSLGLSYEEAAERRLYFNRKYGTVLRGLLQEEVVDIEAYLNFVHDIPVEGFIEPNPDLQHALSVLSQRKYIFTNSYRKHAENVLRVLGISEFFEGIFDIQTVNFVSKPAKYPYAMIVSLLDTEPDKCVYIDDNPRNLKEPKLMGMKTVLVDSEPDEYVDISSVNIVEACYAIEAMIQKQR